jgi:hypothetical protein
MTNPALATALSHLQSFRATFAAEDTVDQISGLTAQDLDTIMAAAKPATDLEPGGTLTADDLGDVA